MSVGKGWAAAAAPTTESAAGSASGTRHLDASGLKAYAHPLRLQIIRYLNDHGSATATQLARHLGESTGQTSYHLRQLARHGLVVDDAARNRGRERWWKATSFQVDAAQLADDPALAPAAQAVLSSVAQGRTEALNRWLTTAREVPREWIDASMHSQSTLRLTPDELRDLGAALLEVVDRYTERSRAREVAGDAADIGDAGHVGGAATDAAVRPDGSVPWARVRAYVDVFPLLDDD